VVWYSDRSPGAPLWEGAPDTSGYTTFTAENLVGGQHIISLVVTDSGGLSGHDDVTIQLP